MKDELNRTEQAQQAQRSVLDGSGRGLLTQLANIGKARKDMPFVEEGVKSLERVTPENFIDAVKTFFRDCVQRKPQGWDEYYDTLIKPTNELGKDDSWGMKLELQPFIQQACRSVINPQVENMRMGNDLMLLPRFLETMLSAYKKLYPEDNFLDELTESSNVIYQEAFQQGVEVFGKKGGFEKNIKSVVVDPEGFSAVEPTQLSELESMGISRDDALKRMKITSEFIEEAEQVKHFINELFLNCNLMAPFSSHQLSITGVRSQEYVEASVTNAKDVISMFSDLAKIFPEFSQSIDFWIANSLIPELPYNIQTHLQDSNNKPGRPDSFLSGEERAMSFENRLSYYKKKLDLQSDSEEIRKKFAADFKLEFCKKLFNYLISRLVDGRQELGEREVLQEYLNLVLQKTGDNEALQNLFKLSLSEILGSESTAEQKEEDIDSFTESFLEGFTDEGKNEVWTKIKNKEEDYFIFSRFLRIFRLHQEDELDDMEELLSIYGANNLKFDKPDSKEGQRIRKFLDINKESFLLTGITEKHFESEKRT